MTPREYADRFWRGSLALSRFLPFIDEGTCACCGVVGQRFSRLCRNCYEEAARPSSSKKEGA